MSSVVDSGLGVAAGGEDETTGEEELSGGGAPGSTPALGGAATVDVFGELVSLFVLVVVLGVVGLIAWQTLQFLRRSLWWCAEQREHTQTFFGWGASCTGVTFAVLHALHVDSFSFL